MRLMRVGAEACPNCMRFSLPFLAALAVTAISPALCAAQAQSAHVQNQASTDSTAPTMTIKQAVSLALQNSSDVKLAKLQYTEAVAETGVDRAAFRPNFYTGEGIAYTYGFPGLPGGSAPALFQLDYTQSIFDPEAKAQQRAAEERARSAKLEIDRVQEDVIARVATTYLELAGVRQSLELLGKEQAAAEKIIEITRERVAANQQLPIDETRAELTSAQVHESLVKLQGRKDVLSQQLRDLTGLPDTAPLEVAEQNQNFDGTLSQESDSEVADLALQNNETIAEAERDRVAKQDLLHGAKFSYFPTFQLVGQYSILSKFNNYSQFYRTFQRNNVNVGVQITIPLFAAKTAANVKYAQAQLAVSQATLDSKRRQVRSDTKEQQQNLRELDASRDVASLALKLAQETVDQQQARLQQGQATLGDVEQAQLDENEKFVDYIDANFADDKAKITLLQATGQLAKVFQ